MDTDEEEQTDAELLLEAAERADIGQLRNLLGAGVSVNAIGPLGFTALMMAAECGHLETVNFLVGAGANPEIRNNEDERNALWLAAKEGHAAVVQALADAKADLEAVTGRGSTALTTAAYHGREDVVRVLLAAGADPKHAPDGKSPAALANEKGHDGIVELLK